ncbi:MAG: GntR family transcriptional regulator [Bryobacterales bacterium]|nr:GntR family transcriptional regulator [Bryobacterales bacterium]MDE0261952.1 GntR family transcriptional regulator [Bryobacterales bacterium]
MHSFERIENPTLRGRISEHIRMAILDGTLKAGSKLVERRLASQFATSLTAVREALIVLEGDGFVTKTPNAATHVTKLTLEDTEKLFDVRRVLERHAVELAARKCSPEHAAELDKAYFRLLDAARGKREADFITTDLDLHAKIWGITGNEYLQAALRRVNSPLFAFVMIRLVADRSAMDLTHDAQSHSTLLEAIKANDAERSRREFDIAVKDWLVNLRIGVFERESRESAVPTAPPASTRSVGPLA